jgi:nucleoside-diphosphate-sugar epimerase
MEIEMRILVFGAGGFVGSVLIPQLLAAGHTVTAYDTFWFGNHLPVNSRLRVVTGDIRDIPKLAGAMAGVESIIHLACISNDPSAALDPAMTRSINLDCFEPCVQAAVAAGIRRFIFASSSSVYGVSKAAEVTEEHLLNPLTDYSRFKAYCEVILRKYQSPTFTTCVVRPATVCGYSPRMRFDLVVNIFTNHAVRNHCITVHGGNQRRPSIHILDLADVYERLLYLPADMIAGQTFNLGRENHTLAELAKIVQGVSNSCSTTPVTIETAASDDLRSYHICSRRAEQTIAFRPYRSVADAARELCAAFKRGAWADSFADEYVNVQVLQAASSKVAPLSNIKYGPELH